MRLGGKLRAAGGAALTLVLASFGTSAVLVAASGGVTPAAASSGTQSGTVSCKSMTGGIRFNPPLKTDGSAPEVTNVRMTVRDCTGHNGGASPHSGSGTEAFSGTNSCTSLDSGSEAITFLVNWSSNDGESEIDFPGFAMSSSGKASFSLGGTGTTVSGSYPGTDGGASSTVTVITNMTSAQVTSACNGSSGLRQLKIRGGSLDLG